MNPDARRMVHALSLLCTLWTGIHHGLAGADQLWREDEQRFRIGLKLFPACVGALVGLDKMTSADGKLLIIVVFAEDDHAAVQAANHLAEVGQIRGLPLEVKTLSASRLDGFDQGPVGAVFVSSIGVEPSRLRAWSRTSRTLVFSPFTGDVEDGAVAGIYVSDRILPLINPAQAKQAHVHFKPFFLRVARTHE